MQNISDNLPENMPVSKTTEAASGQPGSANVSRRAFLKNTSVLAATAAGAGLFGSPSSAAENTSSKEISAPVPLRKKFPIRAVIIGVGGRGSGAGRDFTDACKALEVDGQVVAVADM